MVYLFIGISLKEDCRVVEVHLHKCCITINKQLQPHNVIFEKDTENCRENFGLIIIKI